MISKMIPPLLGYYTMSGGDVIPWYLSGGILASNCVASYQAKGMSSYAASLVNLANPGTYNLTVGNAPLWSTANGWTFDGSNDHFTTGINDADGWSWIVAIDNGDVVDTRVVFGTSRDGAPYEGLGFGNKISTNRQYKNGAYLNKAGNVSSGVFAARGGTVYKDGAEDGTLTNSGCTGLEIPIGCLQIGASKTYYYKGDIWSLALYNTVITEDQVIAITNAINALSGLTSIVAFGDSVTAGTGATDADHRWANIVADSLGAVLYNSGISSTVLQNSVQNSVPVIGAAAANNGRDTYATRVTFYNPTYVAILYGLNDLRLNDVGFSDSNFSNDLGETVDAIVASGVSASNIIIGSPSYIPAASYALASPWDGGTTVKHAAYVAACASVATTKGCKYADVYQAMADGGGDTLMADDYHPNDAGHAVIAAAILNAL